MFITSLELNGMMQPAVLTDIHAPEGNSFPAYAYYLSQTLGWGEHQDLKNKEIKNVNVVN